MTPDVAHMTAAGIAWRIRDGDRSPVEVVAAVLERIEERNDRTNAFVTVSDASAGGQRRGPNATSSRSNSTPASATSSTPATSSRSGRLLGHRARRRAEVLAAVGRGAGL